MKYSRVNKIYALSFLFTLHIALSTYVNSTFLTGIVKENYVGLLYTISSLLILFIFSKSVNILKYFGNRRLTLIFLFINMLSLIGLISSTDPYIVATSFIAFSVTNTLVMFCIDIFIEHFGDPEKTGETRGFYLTIINIAYMLSPLLAAKLITEGGYKFIYIVAFIFVSIMAIGLVFSVKTFKDKKYTKEPFFDAYRKLKGNTKMLSIIVINFLLQFFYAWMVVYTPIYLLEHLNFNWEQIGIIFTIMLVPFVILGMPIGILVDKYKVNKKILFYIGFSIISISTASIALISSNEIITWAVVLFLTRIGASIIETTTEIFFFEEITDKDAQLLSIYRDMFPLAYIIGPVIATTIFLFMPFNKYLFLILGIIMLSGFYYIIKLKNDKLPN